MTSASVSHSMQEQSTKSFIQWRESYTSQFEHGLEAFIDLQEDCSALLQQGSTAKAPSDLMLAWNKFASRRVTHITKAFNQTVKSSLEMKTIMPSVVGK